MAWRCNTFGSYLRARYGTVVSKVNVDAGFTCPNRDGTVGLTGCIYCNNNSFRHPNAVPKPPLENRFGTGYDTFQSGITRKKKFLYTFSPIPTHTLRYRSWSRCIRDALSVPSVNGLAIGTRPDCIDEERIEMIERLAKDHFILIEYGLQSVYDKSLRYIIRGHDYKTFLDAVNLTRGRGIHIGVHIIVGFPSETRGEMLSMADELSTVPIGFLKIHQLQIINGTVLAERYREKPFNTFTYDDYLDFLADFIECLSPEIVLQRLFAMAPDDILIAPKWGKPRQKILLDIQERFISRDVVQGSQCPCLSGPAHSSFYRSPVDKM